MHAARIERSARLQRVLAVLDGGGWHSTMDIVREAGVCAVNSCISELRDNGKDITCRQVTEPPLLGGGRVWEYRLEGGGERG